MTQPKLRGTNNPERILRTLLDNMARSINPVYPLLFEMVANGSDARGGLIEIDILPKDKIFRIRDNGLGFDDESIVRFHSLFLDQTKKASLDRIGKNDSGRLAIFLIAKAVQVLSVSEKYPTGVSFKLTYEDMVQVIGSGIDIDPKVLGRKPADWKAGTGSILELVDVDWDEVPNLRDIINNLPGHLSPKLARLVRLNGESLKDRRLLEQPLDFKRNIPALGGEVETYLYIPEKNSMLEQGVRIGGYNPICGINEFLRPLPPEIRKNVPSILLSDKIQGDILIPVLNKFRAHDSRSFEKRLYEKGGVALEVVKFLIQDLGPEVQRQFALHEEAEEKRKKETVLMNLKERVNRAFKFDSKNAPGLEDQEEKKKGEKPVQTAPFVVSPRSIPLVAEMDQVFSVIREYTSSGEYIWDDSNSGGSVKKKEGKEVLYTAGKVPGRFTLKAIDAKDSSKVVEIRIDILKATPELQISPPQAELVRGGSVRLSVAHPHLLDHPAYKWSMKDAPHGVQLKQGRNGLFATITAPHTCRLDAFAVTVVAVDDEKVKAHSTVQVIELPNDNRPLKIGEHFYRLLLTQSKQPTLVHLKLDSNFDMSGTRKGKLGEIQIYLDHPSIQAAAKMPYGKHTEHQQLIILEAILNAHVCALVAANRLPAEQANYEFDSLRTIFMSRMAEDTKKKK